MKKSGDYPDIFVYLDNMHLHICIFYAYVITSIY